MAKLVRARTDIPPTAMRHPETGVMMVPDPAVPVPENDPLVKAFRWAFETDEEQAERLASARVITEAPVERATARPGEKRTTRKS